MGKYIGKNVEHFEEKQKYFKFEGDNGFTSNFTLSQFFVYNCQICALGNIEQLLQTVKDDSEVLNIIISASKDFETYQPLIFLDCEVELVPRIKTIFDEIIYIQKFISTNNHERAHCLVNIKKHMKS